MVRGIQTLTNDKKSATVPTTSPHDESARTYYDYLISQAQPYKDSKGVKQFVGYLTEAFRQTGLPQSHYVPVRKLLEYNGVMLVEERGFRDTPSVVLLMPMPDVLDAPPKPLTKRDLTATKEFDKLERRVEILEELVGGLHLPSVLQEIAQRLPDGGK